MRKSDQFIKFTFNRQMHSFISSLMIEENGNYFIEARSDKIPIAPYTKPIEVSIPEKFKA
jgi:hypothetical protein